MTSRIVSKDLVMKTAYRSSQEISEWLRHSSYQPTAAEATVEVGVRLVL
ncbi:hypothetical protein [Anabaenopsis elenkinii]|uniref:Uncharacterized protein n=1 Tax=Anabaenopsis elenkinii CCIBt3563 TaxID=2779889 RepID=A0A7S6U3L3_9CYAN|nr:hypothetical protein [Anabaenopsis elenkinii]QOV24265.1 hypothetical protein IM676_08515 [Anabaenopsis elenkinii CCIBt3563]